MEKSKFQPKDFPEILICSEPSFDLKEINSLGYSHSWNYIRGRSVSNNILSLTGNQSQLREGFKLRQVLQVETNHPEMPLKVRLCPD